MNFRDRLATYADRPDDCWLWPGGLNTKGYVTTMFEGRRIQAHRLAYELLVGPIPEGLRLDHLCRVRHCLNPAHLEPVTDRENALRGVGICSINARKTHCSHGHPYDDENTLPRVGSRGRYCRACIRNRWHNRAS